MTLATFTFYPLWRATDQVGGLGGVGLNALNGLFMASYGLLSLESYMVERGRFFFFFFMSLVNAFLHMLLVSRPSKDFPPYTRSGFLLGWIY